jgi:hypothetical protein
VPRTGITKAGTIIYRAHQADCKGCPLKPQCCPNTTHRKIARSIYEESRDKTRAINKTDEYQTKSFHERKKVEMLFAHMKRNLRFTRLRVRGLASANDEFLLMATVQNLRRMAKLCARPPPDHNTIGQLQTFARAGGMWLIRSSNEEDQPKNRSPFIRTLGSPFKTS